MSVIRSTHSTDSVETLLLWFCVFTLSWEV